MTPGFVPPHVVRTSLRRRGAGCLRGRIEPPGAALQSAKVPAMQTRVSPPIQITFSGS
jgi:hypothetical protein